MEILEENIGRTFFDKNCSSIFLDPSPKVMETKTNKWDLIKHKSFCTAKEIINKMKRQLTDWEKIIANSVADKELISQIFKRFMQLNIKKILITQVQNGKKS